MQYLCGFQAKKSTRGTVPFVAYIGVITLGDFTQDEWIYDKRTLENWGKGRITELIAYEPNGKLVFKCIDH